MSSGPRRSASPALHAWSAAFAAEYGFPAYSAPIEPMLETPLGRWAELLGDRSR